MPIINSTNKGTISVVSTVTNLVIVSVKRKMTTKRKILLVYVIIVDKKGIGVSNAESRKMAIKRKKAKKAIDGEDDEFVLCSLAMDNKKENVKRKFGLQKMLKSHWRQV